MKYKQAYNIFKTSKRMDTLEEIANKIRLKIANKIPLNEYQVIELIKVSYIYENLSIKKGSFHEIEYKEYNLDYFIKQIQKGVSYLEIINKILDECEIYSRQQIINKHLRNMKN